MRNALVGMTLLSLACSAANAAVTNPSFESGNVTGWSWLSSGGYNSGFNVADNVANQSAQYPPFGPVLPGTGDGRYYAQLSGFGPEGSNPASSSYAWQDTGALQPNTRYTLTIAIGCSKFDWSPSPGSIALVNGTNQTGTTLSSADVSTLGFGSYANDFRDLTTSFATGPTVSGDLTIRVISAGGFSTYNNLKFDNVRLTMEAVPEPGTVAMIGCAALGGLSIRKRRTK